MSHPLLVQAPNSLQLLDLFVEDCHDRELSDETIRRYRSVNRQFLAHLDEQGVRPVDVDKHVLYDYIRFRRSADVDQKTLENELSAVASLYEFLVFEDYVGKNPVPGVRKRYLRRYKKETEGDVESPRKLISVEEMSTLINSVLDTRDKAILTLLAKTGLRRGELISLNITDINWVGQSITLQWKRFKKRSNRTVFFDDETARVLKKWLSQREALQPETPALFVGEKGDRLKRNGVYSMVVRLSARIHDPSSTGLENHFTVHSFRHFFTSHLLNAGMNRTYVQVLRGDARGDPIDIYHHVDMSAVRKEYLAFIPQLGI
jgi:integrase/recombinase XerD